MKYQAILITEASPGGVRSANFASSWSRLYQADNYYLDLFCKPDGSKASLLGQVLTSKGDTLPNSAQAVLFSSDDVLQTYPITADGTFRFTLEEAGPFRLEVNLPHGTLEIPQLP